MNTNNMTIQQTNQRPSFIDIFRPGPNFNTIPTGEVLNTSSQISKTTIFNTQNILGLATQLLDYVTNMISKDPECESLVSDIITTAQKYNPNQVLCRWITQECSLRTEQGVQYQSNCSKMTPDAIDALAPSGSEDLCKEFRQNFADFQTSDRSPWEESDLFERAIKCSSKERVQDLFDLVDQLQKLLLLQKNPTNPIYSTEISPGVWQTKVFVDTTNFGCSARTSYIFNHGDCVVESNGKEFRNEFSGEIICNCELKITPIFPVSIDCDFIAKKTGIICPFAKDITVCSGGIDIRLSMSEFAQCDNTFTMTYPLNNTPLACSNQTFFFTSEDCRVINITPWTAPPATGTNGPTLVALAALVALVAVPGLCVGGLIWKCKHHSYNGGGDDGGGDDGGGGGNGGGKGQAPLQPAQAAAQPAPDQAAAQPASDQAADQPAPDQAVAAPDQAAAQPAPDQAAAAPDQAADQPAPDQAQAPAPIAPAPIALDPALIAPNPAPAQMAPQVVINIYPSHVHNITVENHLSGVLGSHLDHS